MKGVRLFADIYKPLSEHITSRYMAMRLFIMNRRLWNFFKVKNLLGVNLLGPKLGRAYYLNRNRFEIYRVLTSIELSVMRGELRFFKYMNQADPRPFNYYYYYIDWLNMACSRGHIHICKFFIIYMLSIHYEFPFIDKALKKATLAGHDNICKLLLQIKKKDTSI